MEAVNKILGRIPIYLIAVLYCGYLGFDFYSWINDANSELAQKKASLIQSKQALEANKKKVKTLEDFEKTLELTKAEVRQLMAQLENAKSSLNTDVDVAGFIDMVSLEAKKLGLVIKKIKPEAEVRKEYYSEVPFTIDFRGAFVQSLVFFDRISRLRQIVRVAAFDMKPSGSNSTKYVELSGSFKLQTFKYLGTKADEIAKQQQIQEEPAKPAPKQGGAK